MSSKRKKSAKKHKRDRGVPDYLGSYKKSPEEIQLVQRNIFDKISDSTSKFLSGSGKVVYNCTIEPIYFVTDSLISASEFPVQVGKKVWDWAFGQEHSNSYQDIEKLEQRIKKLEKELLSFKKQFKNYSPFTSPSTPDSNEMCPETPSTPSFALPPPPPPPPPPPLSAVKISKVETVKQKKEIKSENSNTSSNASSSASSSATTNTTTPAAITKDQLKSVVLKKSERSPLKPLPSNNVPIVITLKDLNNVKLRSLNSTNAPLRRSPRGHTSPMSSNPSFKLRKIHKSPGGTPVRKELKPSHVSSPLLRAIQNKFKAANEQSPPSTPSDPHLW